MLKPWGPVAEEFSFGDLDRLIPTGGNLSVGKQEAIPRPPLRKSSGEDISKTDVGFIK